MPRKMPAFEQWEAPWEKKGEDFDADTAKRFIYNLQGDVLERDDRIRSVNRDLTEAQDENDTLTEGLEKARRRGSKKEETSDDDPKDTGMDALLEAKYKAAIKHGLAAEDVGRLVGSTAEEIEKDAESLAKRFAGPASEDDDAEDDTDDGDASGTVDANGEMPTSQPRVTRSDLRGSKQLPQVFDPAKEAALVPQNW